MDATPGPVTGSDPDDLGAPNPDGSDLPEAAERRFSEGAFTSGLSVSDFAACLQMGLEPVGYVQGYCVMQWRWYGAGVQYAGWGPSTTRSGGYSEVWQCPHGFVSAEHRSWGQNYEQTWIEQAWTNGFSASLERMLDEAESAGAHGVVGVMDSAQSLSDMGVVEFRVRGTAVRVQDGPPPHDGRPWSTYLAGQRLAKLVEAGYAPVSIAASLASVRVWANCITQYLTEGGAYGWATQGATQEITQTANAHMAVRRLARQQVRDQLGNDSLHGAAMSTTEHELGEGDAELQCTLRGNRVRRCAPFAPLPVPRPTVRLL
ncbi:MAG: hypothetical protein ACYCVN_09050 [Acidimicrobiales bacterium]